MRLLEFGLSGPDVYHWQIFLLGQGLQTGAADGIYGRGTQAATSRFQERRALQVDGRVGNQTVSAARSLGFRLASEHLGPAKNANFPPLPSFPALASNMARQQVFGKFDFVSRPVPGNPENIVIQGKWQIETIVAIEIPELIGVGGAPGNGRIWFHRKAAAQMAALWSDWAKAGLLDQVLVWGGAFVPRFIRGSKSVLSNHAFGTAFDINMAQNGLGAEPAKLVKPGCVRELVPIAHKHGFFWGGHFSRRDGMHFEIAVLNT